MKSFPIYLNHDPTQIPVGRVELDEAVIPVDDFPDCVISPVLIVDNGAFELKEFGMIQRTTLDTRPIKELGTPRPKDQS